MINCSRFILVTDVMLNFPTVYQSVLNLTKHLQLILTLNMMIGKKIINLLTDTGLKMIWITVP